MSTDSKLGSADRGCSQNPGFFIRFSIRLRPVVPARFPDTHRAGEDSDVHHGVREHASPSNFEVNSDGTANCKDDSGDALDSGFCVDQRGECEHDTGERNQQPEEVPDDITAGEEDDTREEEHQGEQSGQYAI
ncbi:hypothetical protein SAMN05421858_0808 [Haladaptatus litoreus]|uniref:Uncharacterized protein n=1 Tax=Haladaptatus litoreus TaxID=553468 RepID=A0A1N6WNW1_9EURY|nr:hypothetical protein [Haladaptatus litoreus]SIQ91726.1 hypothetical protein SAMN05421858_0808 [Haladaptatus litoreus]